jgi:hypothetical protein
MAMQALAVVRVRHRRLDDQLVLGGQPDEGKPSVGQGVDIEVAAVELRGRQLARPDVDERRGARNRGKPDGRGRDEDLIARGDVEADVIASDADCAGPTSGLVVRQWRHLATVVRARCPRCPVAAATGPHVHVSETHLGHWC